MLPAHPIQISHFKDQISDLKLRQSEICHSGIDGLHSNVMLYYFKVCDNKNCSMAQRAFPPDEKAKRAEMAWRAKGRKGKGRCE